MTPVAIARGALGLAALVPWLALLHISGALGFGLAMISVVAAMAGWGLLVTRLSRIDDAPLALVVHWGLAVMIGLAGLALLVHQLDHVVQLVLVLAGIALWSGLVILDRRRNEARLVAFLRAADSRFWLIPALGVVIVAALHVLGTAGDVTSSPFDDDGSLPAQLHRLWQTGTLADPIGFARDAQLGGNVAASALVTALTGIAWFRVVDGFGFALLLWLAVAYLRPRTATASLWAVLLVFVAASYPTVATDATPRWLATSLLLALFVTFERYAAPEDDRELWPLGLLAAAVAVLRSELIPVAFAIVVSAALLAIGRSGGRRRMFALLVLPLAALLPFVIARMAARASSPASTLVGHHGGVVAVMIFLGLLVIAIWIPLVTSRGPRRWIAIAALVGLAGIVAQVTGTRPHALQLAWSIVVAAGLAIGLGAARTSAGDLRAVALVLSLLAAALIYDGRDVPGRVRWSRRYTELASGIEYLRHAYPSVSPPDPYAPLLASVPPGATVAVWVARPELLDLRRHRILDLRTPRSASRRVGILDALQPEYLLVEDDHLPAERARRDLWFRLACPEQAVQAYCLDDLQALVQKSPQVASDGTLRLVRVPR
ncbi:MAG: hypothetical protein ABI175_28875 [Polyangiales bacterium]